VKRNKRKTLINVILVAISVFSIALTIFVRGLSRKLTTYYVTDSILDSLEPNQILGDDNPVFTVIDKEPNQFTIKWKKSEIHLPKTKVHLKYLGSDGTCIIMGTCWSGKGDLRPQYPVRIDTGSGGKVLVTDSIVKDARLEFYPKQIGENHAGLCHLCQLKIGDITFIHPPCTSRSGHYEKKPIGEEAQVAHEILLGLGMLKSFKYILIDAPASQIEFSVQDFFDPNDPALWRNFPMTIETSKRNNDILFVTIPINGKDCKVHFDTGAACGVFVTTPYWQEFSKLLDYQGPKSKRLRMVDGLKRTDYYTVKELKFAGDVISNTDVITGLSDEKVFKNRKIMVGMEFFQGRILVLDFENELLWLKKVDSGK